VNHVFLLKDKNSELLLQRTEELQNQLQSLKKDKLVSNIFSVTDFIPSQKQQRLYQQQLPDSDSLNNNLKTALANLPFKKEFFKPFINDIEKSKNLNPLDVKSVLATPLGKHLQQDLFLKNNEWVSIIRLTGVQSESALIDWLASKPDIQPYYLNLRQATSSLMSDYQETALYRLLLGSFVIGLILLTVRSRLRAGIILLPIILAVLLSISIHVLLGTQLTLFHILALLLIVGIGLDYSLFFDRSWISTEDYHHRLHGIFISASSTLITFGILGFSDIPVLSALGQTVTFGVLGCFVLTLVFNIKNNEKA
jgi:predicted exporter